MRVLIVEDEPKLASLLRKGLTAQGLAADVATDADEAMWMAAATAYDAITLDVMRDTFAVELLKAGTPIERVSILLGHSTTRITEKHYNPWRNGAGLRVERLVSLRGDLAGGCALSGSAR